MWPSGWALGPRFTQRGVETRLGSIPPSPVSRKYLCEYLRHVHFAHKWLQAPFRSRVPFPEQPARKKCHVLRVTPHTLHFCSPGNGEVRNNGALKCRYFSHVFRFQLANPKFMKLGLGRAFNYDGGPHRLNIQLKGTHPQTQWGVQHV